MNFTTRIRQFCIACIVLGLACEVRAGGDTLGGRAYVTPVPGWERNDPGQQELPTLSYVPSDGRNALVLLTLMPPELSKVTDKDSLRKFFILGATPMFPSPDYVPNTTEFRIGDGIGIFASFVDPSLVGKPPEKGNFKVATSVALLLSNGYAVHTTVFTDDLTSAAFTEGMAIAKGLSISAPGAAKMEGDLVTVEGRDQALRLPPGRFKWLENPAVQDPAYFFLADDRGVALSGWFDKASEFKGMKEFWAHEKASIRGKGKIPIEGERFTKIGDWEVVLYVVTLDKGVVQKNLRACRVAGQTWVDLHLSITSASSTWKDLQDVVQAVSLEPSAPRQ